MRRDDPTTPFDVEADEASDLTEQFWGPSRGWVSGSTPEDEQTATRRDQTGSIRAGLATFRPRRSDSTDRINRVGRTRRHGAFRAAARHRAQPDASLGQLADVHDGTDDRAVMTADQPDLWVEPSTDRRAVDGIDPLLVRLGIVILIGALLVPLALALRPSAAAEAIQSPSAAAPSLDATASAPAVAAVPAEVPSVEAPAAAADGADAASNAAVETSSDDVVSAGDASAESAPVSPAETRAPDATASAASSAADVGDVPQDETVDAGEAATASAGAERLMPECPLTYVAGAGDSWYRIADASGVSPTAVMKENRATVDTPIFPGDEICLPDGATVPSQPTTTTTAPTTTAPATTAPTTTAPPATTVPPATTTPPSAGTVEQIIRDVWPDELEEKALQIAWRESRYVPTAYNGWCCYGLFQLYWTVHRSWLDDYGIYAATDLYDARKNTEAAYGLYQRSGGWGPWGG